MISSITKGPILAAFLSLGACSGQEAPPAGEESAPEDIAQAPEQAPITGSISWPMGFELPAEVNPRFERVVLVTVDTLRADHLSIYGYPRETSPFLDSLAERGVLFERSIATVSHTAPSHASILTGLPPIVHGVFKNGDTLDPRAQGLSVMHEQAGFETAAFVNTQFLEKVAMCFETKESLTGLGDSVVDGVEAWLTEGRQGERFFLWVHLFDPHHWTSPQRAPGEAVETVRSSTELDDQALYDYLARLHGLPNPAAGEPFQFEWDSQRKRKVRSRRDYLDLVDAYDGLILHSDRQVQRLYEAIETLALPGETLWIVTSDHGEGLGSHGISGHGGYLFQEQLRVPLLVHASGDSLAPRRVSEVVQHMDLHPTLAAALGARVGAPGQQHFGRSLWPLLEGNPGWEARAAFSHRRPQTISARELKHSVDIADEASWNAVYALQTDEWKVFLRRTADDELFDLRADPMELENRLEAETEKGREMLADLERRVEHYLLLQRESYETGISPEVLEELRSLGYVE